MKTNQSRSVKGVVEVPGTELVFNTTVEKHSSRESWTEFTQIAGPVISKDEFLQLLPQLSKLARRVGK